MQQMLNSSGKIVVGKALEVFSRARPYWMILRCDQGIMEYYRWWIHNSFRDVWGRQIYKTSAPLAQSHISIVRGENPSDKGKRIWDTFLNKTLKFSYSPDIRTNGKHWWLEVSCPDIYDIRESLGLRPVPKLPLHLTVATNRENCLVQPS